MSKEIFQVWVPEFLLPYILHGEDYDLTPEEVDEVESYLNEVASIEVVEDQRAFVKQHEFSPVILPTDCVLCDVIYKQEYA